MTAGVTRGIDPAKPTTSFMHKTERFTGGKSIGVPSKEKISVPGPGAYYNDSSKSPAPYAQGMVRDAILELGISSSKKESLKPTILAHKPKKGFSFGNDGAIEVNKKSNKTIPPGPGSYNYDQ